MVLAMFNDQLINLFESARPNLSIDQINRLTLFINQGAVGLEFVSVMLRMCTNLLENKKRDVLGVGEPELRVILRGLSDHSGLLAELLKIGISAEIISASFETGVTGHADVVHDEKSPPNA